MMNSRVSILKCADYAAVNLQEKVRQLVFLLGGMEKFVRPGSKVLVKPNLLMSTPPEAGVTTHPEVMRAVIRMLKELNCRVIVGDGPSVWGQHIENVDEVYSITGMRSVCAQEGAELIHLDKRRMREKFPLAAILDECDFLVSLPKFKTHEFTLLTGAVKNLFGLVSGTFKTELHKNYFEPKDFAKILADIYRETPPSLTIVDGIVAMEGDGPGTGGKLRNLGLLLAGADCVALDAVMAHIMGIGPLEVLSTKEAYVAGLGQADLKNIEISGEKLNTLAVKPFILPAASRAGRIPKPLRKILKKLIRYYPYCLPENCISCLACVKICPGRCISPAKKGMRFDYARCIACFCCQETCPASAIKVRKSLLARMIGL